jgi:signal transduction histidine kinase
VDTCMSPDKYAGQSGGESASSDALQPASGPPVRDQDGATAAAALNGGAVVPRKAEKNLRPPRRKTRDIAFELQLAEERERCRIAGELHDRVAPNLLLSRMKIDALSSLISSKQGASAIEAIDALLAQAILDIRSLTFQLRPPILANRGLSAALIWLAEEFRDKYGLVVTMEGDSKAKPLRYEIRSTLFQVVRELIYNIVKHAGTKRAVVVVRQNSAEISVTVSDEGTGFDVATVFEAGAQPPGYGLSNIKQKVEYFNGQLVFDTAPGCGTRVTVTLPVDIESVQER